MMCNMGGHVLILSSVLTKDRRRHQTKAGATGGGEPSDAGTGGQTQVLCKGSVCSYLWAYSPACILPEAQSSFLMISKCCANSFLLSIPPKEQGKWKWFTHGYSNFFLTPSFLYYYYSNSLYCLAWGKMQGQGNMCFPVIRWLPGKVCNHNLGKCRELRPPRPTDKPAWSLPGAVRGPDCV